MENISFSKIHNNRLQFMQNNCKKDHVIVEGAGSVLISCPHGVPQLRLGKYKYSEIGSLATALVLKEQTGCHLIAKTKSNMDDANFDERSPYKNDVYKAIELLDIKYVIDIHGLASSRECDVNLGTHIGKNVQTDPKLLDDLKGRLTKAGFVVWVDQPFMATSTTISSDAKNKYPRLWTLQIEINCSITNQPQNIDKYNKLLQVLAEWIKSLK